MIIADVDVRKHHQQLDESLIFFAHTLKEISKVVFLWEMHTFITSICCIKCMHLYSKHTSENCANWIASTVKGMYCMTEISSNNFCRFLAKNNPDFVQSLVAFCYSNICYNQVCVRVKGTQISIWLTGLHPVESLQFLLLGTVCSWAVGEHIWLLLSVCFSLSYLSPKNSKGKNKYM